MEYLELLGLIYSSGSESLKILIFPACVVHLQKMLDFSHALCGFSPVVCRQLSFHPPFQVCLFGCVLHFSPLFVFCPDSF